MITMIRFAWAHPAAALILAAMLAAVIWAAQRAPRPRRTRGTS